MSNEPTFPRHVKDPMERREHRQAFKKAISSCLSPDEKAKFLTYRFKKIKEHADK